MKNIIIIGATSAIAEEVAKKYASNRANIYLLARDVAKLKTIEHDLKVRGANAVYCSAFDAHKLHEHKSLVELAFKALQWVDVVLIAHGSLPNQETCQEEAAKAIEEIETNGISIISLLTHIAKLMEQQKSGNVTVITSVAGDRGRQSNYVYGAAKSLVSTYLEGLSQRLSKLNIHVLDIKPGFVDTPMTQDFDKGILWSKPEQIANIIVKRIDSKSTFSYTPSFWAVIMLVIKLIPKFIFNRVKL